MAIVLEQVTNSLDLRILTAQNTHTMTAWKDIIITEPDIISGKPVIKGTRLGVDFIIGRLADGWSTDDLFESYPTLTEEGLRDGKTTTSSFHTRQLAPDLR